MIVELESDSAALQFASRSILLRSVYQLFGHGDDYPACRQDTQNNAILYQCYMQDSFRIQVYGHERKISQRERVEIMESFSFMDFQGEITMKNPQVDLCILEDNEKTMHLPKNIKQIGKRKHVYLGRKIADGQRHLIDVFDLKKRKYIGNTSFDAELSLIMANQALVRRLTAACSRCSRLI